MKLDGFGRVAVLFDGLHAHAGVLSALAHVSHPLQPLDRAEREPLIHRDGVKQVQLCAGPAG